MRAGTVPESLIFCYSMPGSESKQSEWTIYLYFNKIKQKIFLDLNLHITGAHISGING